MKRKYSIKIVWDYINGLEVNNIDELENDCMFMMDVIRITRDKNMYNLCSDEVKRNYEFVKFMIETFSYDKKFVNEIACSYLDSVDEDDITAKELIFILCEVFKNCKYEYLKYFVMRTCICSYERVMVDAIVREEENPAWKKEFGLGFILILVKDIGNSDIIVKYIASEYLYEIFYENNEMTLEKFMHKKFNNPDKIKNTGVKNFIIEYVSTYDANLSAYLCAHLDLLKGIEKDIERIIKNWTEYNIRTLIRKNNIFMQETYNLIEQYNSKLTYREICWYIDKKLNLPVKLSLNDEEFDCDFMEYTDLKRMNLNDYRCLMEIVELAKELYLSSVIDNNTEKYDKPTECVIDNNKCKMLKFYPKTVNNSNSN